MTRWKGRVGCFGSVLGLKSRDVGPDLRLVPVLLQKSTDPGPSITEQRFMDEIDGRRRALDVQQDGADLRQRDAAPRGM